MTYEEFCWKKYQEVYNQKFAALHLNNEEKKEREAQRTAIRDTTIEALKQYETIEPADIWKSIYGAHLSRKAGVALPMETVHRVISADNSWAKSSGHAFEEMIKILVNESLDAHGIKIYLQRDLRRLIQMRQLDNEVRDISWIKEQTKSSNFDLYISVLHNGKRYVYGCIQSKTSIRDRVTRDREPSENAMSAYFWSVAIVMDGDFLRLPKFKEMVNGGGHSYPRNGWHGLYVFSEQYSDDRIYPININLNIFSEHAIKAANHWLTQRQWFNRDWRPT